MQRYGIITLLKACFIVLACNYHSTFGCECDKPDPNAEIVVGAERFKEIVVCIGDEVDFSGSNSSDPDGTTLSYSWDFGDDADGETGASSVSASCYYTASGEKTVTLTVTDNDEPGCCGSAPTCKDKKDDDEVTVTVVGIGSLDLADPNGATLIEEDDNTKVYVVGVADSGYLVVKAVPDPNVEELPDCWNLTGGDVQDELHSHVSLTQPDKITVTCTAGTDSKSVTIYVVKVDLSIGLSEENEEDPGKYINVNWDDDDGDGWDPNDTPPGGSYTGDKDDTNIVGGEYPYPGDFRKFSISISPTGIPQGSVTLSYPGKVKVWETDTKLDAEGLSSAADSSYEPNQLPLDLYLEGVSGSTEFRDVELKAAFSAGGGAVHEDIVKVTVFEVELAGLYSFGPQQNDNEDAFFDGSTGTPSVSSNNCGIISWDDANADGTKGDKDPNCKGFHNCMECQGTVDPNSTQNEFDFDIKRDVWGRILWQINNDPNWKSVPTKNKWIDDHRSDRKDQDYTPSPDPNNHIYLIDGPGPPWGSQQVPSPYSNVTVYMQVGVFREAAHIEIEGAWYQCSDFHKWHMQLVSYRYDHANKLFTRSAMSQQKLGDGWIYVYDIGDF